MALIQEELPGRPKVSFRVPMRAIVVSETYTGPCDHTGIPSSGDIIITIRR